MYYITDRNGYYVNKCFGRYSEAKKYAERIQGEVITDCWMECYSNGLGNFVIVLN